jgi:imidazole glycerol-phosphate synthase subunit HisH
MDVLVIDYSMGNLRSVANALRAEGAQPVVSRDPDDLAQAAKIVLPGVGAFGDGMRNLREGGWIEPLEREVLEHGKAFLGLCVGMQLLASRGTEHGEHAGLGWIEGTVDRLPSDHVRVPHIGWNDVEIRNGSLLYTGLEGSATFYFVHSYALIPREENIVTGSCSYGMEFAASVELGNIHATQYHPEKSQGAGLAVIRNFLERC